MAGTNGQYCPIIHKGVGLAIAERLNDMFGVSPDDIVAVLRRAYAYDNTAFLPDDKNFNIDDFLNTEGMKQAMAEYFGYGKSTFIVHTQEEYDSYTNLYNRFQKNGYIDENGRMTVGGLANQDEFFDAFAGLDDYETYDRIHLWKDSQGNTRGALSKPVLLPIEDVKRYFDDEGNVRQEYEIATDEPNTQKIVEEISPADVRNAIYFMGLTPSDLAHNESIIREAFEKAADLRKQRLNRASNSNSKKSPMAEFRDKFADKNMLNFLAEIAVRRISNIVSELQDDPRAKYRYVPGFPEVNFTKLTRKEILKNQDYFNAIKRATKQMEFARRTGTYNEETGDYDFNEPALDDILEMIYEEKTQDVNNFDLLLQYGKKLLRHNEGLILQENLTIQDANDDEQPNTEEEETAQIQYQEGEGGDVEEDNQYKLAEPSVPASQKITEHIKLMLGNVPNIGTVEFDDGTTTIDRIEDPWGFGYTTFINPGRAVNTILNITEGADTIDEMIERLENNENAFPWLSYVLDRITNRNGTPLSIDKEKLQNEFFASFRKDKTIFTGTSVVTMPDGTVQIRYAERNRGAEARKEKANLRGKYEKRGGMPLFKNGNIDFSGTFDNSPFQYILIGFDPRTRGQYNILKTLSDLYDEDPDALYRSVDAAMRNKNSAFTRIYEALGYFGIKCSPTAFYAMAMADKEGNAEKFEDTNIGNIATNLFRVAFRLNLFNPSRPDAIPYYNPFNWDERSQQAYQDQVDLATPYNEIIDTIEAFTETNTESVAHVNGRAHYAFNYPTFMQTTIAKLANRKGTRARLMGFFAKRYDNEWYSYIDEDGQRHYYLDILEQIHRGTNASKLEYLQKLDFNGVDYKKMSPRGYALAILSDYFTQRDRSTAVYRAPIASDKPAMDGMRWIRYNDHSDTSNNYKELITTQVWNIVSQEINRSRRVLQRAIEGKKPIANFDIKLKSKKEKDQLNVILNKMKNGEDVVFSDLFVDGKYLFRRSGVGFKFVRLMNNVLLNTNKSDEGINAMQKAIIDAIFNGSDSIKNFSDTFASLFQASMSARVNSNWQYLHDIGVFDTIEQEDIDGSKFYIYKNLEFLAMQHAKYNGFVEKIDGQYPDYLPRDIVDDVIRDMLEEFAYNNFIMQIQMAELFGVDLAYYKGTTDFQKRSAQTRSTGQKLNKNATIFGEPVTDGKLRTITVNSIKHRSYAIDDIKSVLENYAETITDAREKASFKQSIPEIIKMYDSVDATDGQAWNVLSALRKKHIMAAKWTYDKDDARIGEMLEDGTIFLNETSNTDEAVYRRMKLGKPTDSDFFHVFTQVDKPFVYDVSVRDGAPVPLQQKNAEYTYVLVNQFMTKFKPNNPLTVLINALEKTHERNGKKYLTGIDTVNFDSSVKVGTRDGFNMATDIETLTKQLNEILHIDKDLDENQYENEWVDEIDVESYAYQQNNPEHFIKHWQLLGSQEKILAVANTKDEDVIEIDKNLTVLKSVTDANSMTGKELKEAYFDVLKKRVILSENMLRDELKLNSGERTKFAAISDKLKKSLVLGKKYSADDVMAVSIFGRNFLLSAEDATQAANIKAVTASWVRKAMYRQEILGGPIVQATGFGQSKELKTVIENGQFKHFQTIIPMPDQIRQLLRNESGNIDPKYYNKKTGQWNFAEITKRLKDVGAEQMLRILLYRIPTEGKYSVFPCQVVGFVPDGGGSTVWLPDDGTTIAGFDFDTDKLFAIMKEFASRDDKLLFRHDNGNVIEYTPEAKSNYGKMAGYNNLLFDLQWLSLTTLQSASEIFDPGNFEDLTNLSFKVELMRAVDNRGNHLYTIDEINSMNDDELKDAWEDLNDLDITDIQTMVTLHRQNMGNKDMLGIAAVANISHAQISMFTEAHPIFQRIGKNTITVKWKDKQGLDRIHKLGDYTVGGSRGNVPMDQRLDFNGDLISKHLRKYIGAAADGAKNPTLSRLGVDDVIFPVIQWLLRAGVPKDIAHLYTSLPVFGELSAVHSMMNDDERTSVNKAINKMEQMLYDVNPAAFENAGSAYRYRSNRYLNDKGFPYPLDIVLDETELRNALYNSDEIALTAQFHLLEQFRFLSNKSSIWTTVSDYGRINSAVAGPKASKEENDERARKVFGIAELFPSKTGQYAEVVGMTYEEFKSYMPYETQMRESIESLLDAIQGDLFPSYQSPSYMATINFIEVIIGNEMTVELKEKFNRAQKMMALSTSGYKSGMPDFIMMYNDEEVLKFFKNFADYYEKELRELKAMNEDLADFLNNNILLNLIGEPVDPTINVPIKLLNTEIFGADDTYKYQITMSWQDLLDYENEEIGQEGNRRVHKLGLDLFRYFTLRNMGKDFDPRTPWHLAPLDLKLMIPGYNERLKDPQSFVVNEATFAIQFILNNAFNPNVLSQIEPSLFGIEDLSPNGTIDLSEDEVNDLAANRNILSANGLGFKPMFYCGSNIVLMLGDKDSIIRGFVDLEPYEDEETGVVRYRAPYHFVASLGIPDIIEEYYPYLRNSVFGFYNPEDGTFFDDSEYKQGNLTDFESERLSLIGIGDMNVNQLVNEILSNLGFKFSDVIEARQENFSVSKVRIKNYMQLSDGALLQKLGFKKASTEEEETTQQNLLNAIRERLEDIC